MPNSIGIPNNGNLPPGVSDNDPYFNPPDNSPYEIREVAKGVGKAANIVMDAADLLYELDGITKDDLNGIHENIEEIVTVLEDELNYCASDLEQDW